MEPFYVDEDAAKRSEAYAGKNLGEIMDIERKVFAEKRPEIDKAHDEHVKSRSRMLTVQKLIDWLKTQDPDACILAYEPNSEAYIEQFPELPNSDVLNVADAKRRMAEHLKHWYRGTENAEERIKQDIERDFRYAEDNDVIIKFC